MLSKRYSRFTVISLLLITTLSGCATVNHPDPLESLNRKTFAFNDKLDRVVIKPVAKGYQQVVPQPVRTSISHFYDNPKDLISAVSLLLQNRPDEAFSDMARFGINTTVGLLGFFDVATHFGIEKHGEDLGQVLGNWGMGPGAYIVWPIFGPSSVRDTATLIGNLTVTPQALFVHDDTLYYSLAGLQFINARSKLLISSELVEDSALDPYLSIRDAYLQQRELLVNNGKLPFKKDDNAEYDPNEDLFMN